VKKSRAVRILLVFALLGFALAWWVTRNRDSVTTHDEPAPLATLDDVSSDEYVADELVVDFRDDEPADRIEALAKQYGVHFQAVSDETAVDKIFTVDTGDAGILAALRANPDVEAADFELLYSIPEDVLAAEEEGLPANQEIDPSHKDFPNDPKYKYQWHLEQIHAKQAWKGSQGEGVIVAVIDTGVAKVPDLANTELVPGFNFVNNTADATDDHGHGTHVAGTIAQSTHNGVGVAGVAFKAKIMPIKVLSARGSGSVSGIAEGIRWAADHGAKVINMSLGGPMASSVLSKAVKYAHDKGVVVVCAAGNDGRGKVSYPAAYPGAFAVAATQFDESTTFYSNWGKEIDIAAPGGNTRVDQNNDGMMDGVLQNTVVPGNTSQNDYLLFMGTSMASPHVAGVAALVVGAGVTNPDKVEQILKDTARQPKLKPKDSANRYGAGIVDAEAAVKKARTHEGAWELGIAGGAALFLLGFLRRRGGPSAGLGTGLGGGGIVALVLGSSGLFFLPLLGLDATMLTHGLPAWDLMLGPAHHGNPLLYSALIPVMATLLLYGRPKLRGALAGLSIGVGAHLAFTAFAGTTALLWLPGAVAFGWLMINALVSFTTALLVLRK
jgi:serine protease